MYKLFSSELCYGKRCCPSLARQVRGCYQIGTTSSSHNDRRDESLLHRIQFLDSQEVVQYPIHVRLIYETDAWLLNTMRYFFDSSYRESTEADLSVEFHRYRSLLSELEVCAFIGFVLVVGGLPVTCRRKAGGHPILRPCCCSME